MPRREYFVTFDPLLSIDDNTPLFFFRLLTTSTALDYFTAAAHCFCN